MKVDIIKKFKWYIVGFILVAIMLSVSLSFCTWDTLSAKASMNAKGGIYTQYPTKYKLAQADDINKNNVADVGDIVTFGRYYQELTADGNVADKTPIRWIVVHKENNQLTLLAEKVMAFGSFWGTYCYTSSGGTLKGDWGAIDIKYHTNYQNYSQSTVRAWLNSDYTLRNDGGTPFSANGTQQFKGFLSEAFTADEQAYITDKTISGIKGAGKANVPTKESYETVEDKVWIPSWSEVYGTTITDWGTTIDGSPNARFSYFDKTKYNEANLILNGYTTAYASTIDSNYTMDKAMGTDAHQNISAGGNVWWWLRSPTPSSTYWHHALIVGGGGGGGAGGTGDSRGGVRPAVSVQL